MALQGTHIRLACDLQEALAISDSDSYISGTIYPEMLERARKLL